MTGSNFVILSFAISHGIPLALALRELLTMRPPAAPRDDRRPPEPDQPVPQRPLPACLLPAAAPVVLATAPVRVLEDA